MNLTFTLFYWALCDGLVIHMNFESCTHFTETKTAES